MFLSRRVLHAIARKWTSVTHTTNTAPGLSESLRCPSPPVALPCLTLPRMCIACSLARLGVCLSIYLAHCHTLHMAICLTLGRHICIPCALSLSG